jgi:hypothetical protein
MNTRADADPSVGSCGHGWRADTDRGGDGWQDRSGDRPASGLAFPWGDGRGDHERTDHPRKGHEPAGKYDDVQASGRSLHHHDPELISDPSSDPSSDPGGDPGADASTDLGGLAVLIGGFAAASGELTLATGAVQSTAQERAGVSIAWGAAVFEAYGYGQQPTEAFAAADTWLQVTGADLLLRWDLENSGSDPGADQAWAHSEIDYMAIDIPAWSPAQPLVIELAQAFALQPLAADLGPSSDGSLNYAAVAAAVQADGTNALALTSTQAFTDKSVSFVHAMALASL